MPLQRREGTRSHDFIRQDTHKKKELHHSWRKPSGLQSKQLKGMKGHPIRVKVGWGSARSIKGTIRGGILPVVVASRQDLEALTGKKNVIVLLAKKLGMRTRLEFLKRATELKLPVANANAESILQEFATRKENKKTKKQQKTSALDAKVTQSQVTKSQQPTPTTPETSTPATPSTPKKQTPAHVPKSTAKPIKGSPTSYGEHS